MAEFKDSGRRLEDVLTRYQVLADLRETWMLGVEACTRVQPQYRGKADEILISSLTAALELLENQINLMAKFDMGKYSLGRVIDGIPTADKISVPEREGRQNQNPNVPDGDGTPALG